MDGVVEVEGLVAKLLPELQALRDREGGSELRFLTLLFAIDLGPLGLVAGSEQWPCMSSQVPNGTPPFQGSVTGVAAGAPVFNSVEM
jgi:hypothetical protein